MTELDIIPSGKPAGAEIRGVDVGRGVAPEVMAQIRDALHTYKAVVLRGQKLTAPQQIAFSGYFGKLERHVIPQYLVPGYEDLVRVSNILDDAGKPIGLVDAGRIWHSDGHFLPKPNLYSMLYALEIPHDQSGKALGETLFANTAHACATLPDAMRQRIVAHSQVLAATVVPQQQVTHLPLVGVHELIAHAPIGQLADEGVAFLR